MVLAELFRFDTIGFTSVSEIHCNPGAPGFDSNAQVNFRTQNGRDRYVSNPNDRPTIVDGVITSGSRLICPVAGTFTDSSNATTGADGATRSAIGCAGVLHSESEQSSTKRRGR